MSTSTRQKKKNPFVVVTGGSRGIGRATCLLLASQGYDVACVFRSDSSIKEVASLSTLINNGGSTTPLPPADSGEVGVRVVEGMGVVFSGFQYDVSDELQVTQLFQQMHDHFGREPTCLVNNAGIVGPVEERDIVSMKKEELDLVLATNVYGPFFCCREFVRRRRLEANSRCSTVLDNDDDDNANDNNNDNNKNDASSSSSVYKKSTPHHKKKERTQQQHIIIKAGGTIVNVTSGLMKQKGHPLFYSMSKGCLDSMMLGLSKALPDSDGIRMNAVAPGTTKTDLVSDQREREVTESGVIPMGRIGTPEEVAEVIAFLLGKSSSYCCGATISITGGR